MPEEEQQNKSTRSFEEWKGSLINVYTHIKGIDVKAITEIKDEQIKPYYDQGLQPYVAFNELFNK